MKFAAIALAFVATTTAQDCRTKAGQVDYIKGLITQWGTYNREVAYNAGVTGDQDVVQAEHDAVDAEAAAFTAEKGANLTIATNAKIAASVATRDTALAENAANLAAWNAKIVAGSTARNAKINADNQKYRAGLDEKIVGVNAKKAKLEAWRTKNLAKALAKHTAQRAKSASKLARQVATAQSKQGLQNTKHAERLAEKVQNNSVALNTRLAAAADKLSASISALEASKRDSQATLDSIDNAGSTGLAFPADCLLAVDDVIAEVKLGYKAAEIWQHLIYPTITP